MNAFFTALYNIFSAPAVVGMITACDAASHISGITKAIKEKIADESIESKMIVALEKALEATCDKLGWEYDSLVVRELGNFVKAQPLSVEELSDLFMMYVGPSFTPDVISVWIDNFDQVVAGDQILSNYFTTKLLRSLAGITSDISENTTCITHEDDKFEEIMFFSPTNRLVFDDLREVIKSGTKIMPFVGAGVSAFSYKTWKEMLRDYLRYLDDLKKEKITGYIERNELLEAAQLICDAYGKTMFFKKLRQDYSEDKIDDNLLKKNAAYYIPRIGDGNCITTNYDRVLEHAYNLNSIVYDVADVNDAVKLATFYRNSKRKGLIFKIHGDILSNSENILLSKNAYQENYAKGSELRKQLERWIAGRVFLFVGTSLFNDEPIKVLMDITEEGIENYAIYPCSYDNMESLKAKFDELRIMPIFYDERDHSCLTIILKKLLNEF